MRTTMIFSKLLGGTWILWVVAFYIFGRVVVSVSFPNWSDLILVDVALACLLVFIAGYQSEQKKTTQYILKQLTEEKAKLERKINLTLSTLRNTVRQCKEKERIIQNELNECKTNLYESALNMTATILSALSKKPAQKSKRER